MSFSNLFLSVLSLHLWSTEARNHSELINSQDTEDVSSESRNQIGIIAANSYRKIHGVPPLGYNQQLAEHAAAWAGKVLGKILSDGKLKPYYSHPVVEGENVMVLEGPVQPLSLGEAITEWYSEIKNFDFKTNTFTHGTAQFTQLIWKETSKIGLGTAYDPKRNWLVVVARFKPVGNTGYHNSFGSNVFPPNANHSEVKSLRSNSSQLDSHEDDHSPTGIPIGVKALSTDISRKMNQMSTKTSGEPMETTSPGTSPAIPATTTMAMSSTSPTSISSSSLASTQPPSTKLISTTPKPTTPTTEKPTSTVSVLKTTLPTARSRSRSTVPSVESTISLNVEETTTTKQPDIPHEKEDSIPSSSVPVPVPVPSSTVSPGMSSGETTTHSTSLPAETTSLSPVSTVSTISTISSSTSSTAPDST